MIEHRGTVRDGADSQRIAHAGEALGGNGRQGIELAAVVAEEIMSVIRPAVEVVVGVRLPGHPIIGGDDLMAQVI